MRVTVSVAGRFHAYQLVEQLAQRGHLDRFITSTLNEKLLPNRRLPNSLRENSEFIAKIRQVPMPEYLGYGVRRLPVRDSQLLSYFVKDNLYDRLAVKHITNGDLFVGWASQSLFQMREAKARGAHAIIERGSTHISEQYRLIEEERKRFGVATPARSRWERLLEEKQLKEYHEADFIMTPSQFARQSFLDRGFDPKKILKVRYGVDLGDFHVSAQPEDHPIPTLIFVGAIGFQKGIPYLLEAARSLRATGKKFHLKLIGRFEKDFETWLRTSSLRSEIDEHIAFVPNRELVRHFHSADIFVLPSVQEGLALVIAEAMASGLPVIATENTGAREFIDKGTNGLIIPAANTQTLIAAIAELSGSPQSAKSMGEEAAQKAQSFSWDVYGDSIEQTYKNIVEPSTPSTKSNQTTNDQSEISTFYNDYWNRDQGWTPTHSFTQAQLDLHFKNAFRPSDSVLDVGSGDASNYQAWLVKQVRDLKAIDISTVGIERARRMGIDARVHDLSERFPFESNSFDGAVCIEVLEHLNDPKFTAREIFRVLKPGGLLVTSVPNNGYFRERLRALTKAELSTSISDFSNEWKGAHIRFYNLASFSRLLEVCGFQIESVRSNGDASIFDGLDSLGGYAVQHASSYLRRKLPRAFRFAFLEHVWPSLFAPHLIVRARKPGEVSS
ncbi:MAG: glycosyltransferase [Candidatus Kapaibacterium sp.]